MTTQTLAQKLDAIDELIGLKSEMPTLISENLKQGIKLRPYQLKALSRLFFYLNDYKEKSMPTHLLFYMATGSGKTVLMASSILYLYSLGYRNFLFFVNNTNIIEKTKDNFLNQQSIKYLFNNTIKFGNKIVKVLEKSNFQDTDNEAINIVFNTIQGLHSDLTNPKENSLTFEDFEDKKIVLISDEAHHINASTKNLQTGLDIEATWENTVQKIFNANRDNILLEYTATVDLEHIKIKEKYEQKLIYQYSLKEFREDKYSKDVKVLESDTDSLQRALQAILVSQYRRKVAQDNKIYLKPVVLFKSKTIKESQEFEESFYNYIENLKITNLEQVLSKKIGVIQKAFDYFYKNEIKNENLIKELQEEFSRTKCISVNSKDESDEKQILVNTLEAHNNEIRAIFAVDKLNEGWDVLNLFDIVRLYDTRDSKGSSVGKTTMAEAQLIGRGARYFPFAINPEQEKEKRKFDEDLNNDLRILEELYYHSAYNPRYIWELEQALKETGIKAKEEFTIELKLKEAFKNSSFWKTGIVYLNEKLENKNTDKNSLEDYEIDKYYKYNLETGFTRETAIFDFQLESQMTKEVKTYSLSNLGINVFQKALDKLDFFHYSNLVKYLPNNHSIEDILKFIAQIKVEVSGSKYTLENITQNQKLEVALYILQLIKYNLIQKSKEYIGTKVFKANSVSKIFADKILRIDIDEDSDKEIGKSMSKSLNPSFQLNLFDSNWYAYEDDYGTSEEKYLVKFVNTALEKLTEKYDDIYLVRNSNAFKIYNFPDGSAFEPDYVLFLKDKLTQSKIYYQVFIEPKGKHLLKLDEWKETFLKSISNSAEPEIIHSDREYRLIGLPFFNEEVTKLEFIEAFDLAL